MLFIIAILWLSFLFAKVEIHIEGKHGWAENLPTWKLPLRHWISRFVFGNKPATGYHLWLNLFIISFVHAIYIVEVFSLSLELKLISFIIFFWVTEDFLWFVLNPDYGIKNFKKEKIWWHRDNWWGIAPRDYFIALPIALLLYVISLGIL